MPVYPINNASASQCCAIQFMGFESQCVSEWGLAVSQISEGCETVTYRSVLFAVMPLYKLRGAVTAALRAIEYIIWHFSQCKMCHRMHRV